MLLNKFVTCPESRSKLCKGPLACFINYFCFYLQDLGFSHSCIYKHLLNLSRFNDYLAEDSPLPLAMINSLNVERFFKLYFLPCKNGNISAVHLRNIHYSINRFIVYLKQQGCFIKQKQIPIYQPLQDSYLLWLKNYQHLAPGTIDVRRHSIRLFLLWLGLQATCKGLEQLSAQQVETFFLTQAKSMGPSARRSLQAALRTFFRFCLQKGFIKRSLDKAVPTIRVYKLATVPRAISEADAKRLLESIDRSTPVGKRDYAIITLLYTFGVRGGQVAALRLTDIDWAKAQVLFRAMKQGKDTLLPLPEDVGHCLLDYLKDARPNSQCPAVFLTSRGPHRALCHSSMVSELVRRHLVKAGIDLPTKGAHLFRHCFAGRMIQQGNSLKSVADLLGHRALSTTFIYTKIDFNALKQVALPWPQGESSC
ncbi:MAG TPA: hypothetical protein DCR37_10755 [Glaciecola sp.]|nr:hypothetical protein [Glaciecola sp.]